MTTSAIIAGLLPTALGLGIGGAQRSAIAVTIIGGQSLCLFLTLLLVPVAYAKLDALEQSLANQRFKAWMARLRPVDATSRDWPPDVGGPGSTRKHESNHRGAERTLKDCDGQHKCEGTEAVEACAEISGRNL